MGFHHESRGLPVGVFKHGWLGSPPELNGGANVLATFDDWTLMGYHITKY